jgi:hypothetical protein
MARMNMPSIAPKTHANTIELVAMVPIAVSFSPLLISDAPFLVLAFVIGLGGNIRDEMI